MRVGRIVWGAVALFLGGVAFATVKPELFGLTADLATRFPGAHIISLRGWLAAILAIIAVFFLVVGLVRRVVMRRGSIALALAAALFLAGGLHGATLVHRGITDTGVLSSDHGISMDSAGDGSITVMQVNTEGSLVSASELADVAHAHGADIITLVETAVSEGKALQNELKDRGLTYRMFDNNTSRYQAAWGSTIVLVSTDLGSYSYADVPEALAKNKVPTVALASSEGKPDIFVVHAQSPSSTGTTAIAAWKTQISAIYSLCEERSDALIAGDFNSTADHEAALGFSCNDAMAQAGSGGLGTWPSNLPPLLAAPIDRIMAPSGYVGIEAALFTAGNSDHRGILVRLAKK